ncbi:MAG: hypothetical protein ACP5MB_07565 [bacterium]
MDKLYDFINLTPNELLVSTFTPYIIFDLLLYFLVESNTFATVNPIILYSIPLLAMAVISGAVGGNLFAYIFQTEKGHFISKKQFVTGLVLGAIIGSMTAYLMAFVASPILQSIGLNLSPASIALSVDPVALQISNIMHAFSFLSILTSYSFVFYLVVAVSEELLVIITYKNLAQYFYAKHLPKDFAIYLSLILVGISWASLHWAAYGVDGLNVIAGIILAAIVGTIAFRVLSRMFWKDLDFTFMVTSHWAYDFTTAAGVMAIAMTTVPVHGVFI